VPKFRSIKLLLRRAESVPNGWFIGIWDAWHEFLAYEKFVSYRDGTVIQGVTGNVLMN
jgi:hypothetical protein